MNGDGISIITVAKRDALPPPRHRSQGEDPASFRRTPVLNNSQRLLSANVHDGAVR